MCPDEIAAKSNSLVVLMAGKDSGKQTERRAQKLSEDMCGVYYAASLKCKAAFAGSWCTVTEPGAVRMTWPFTVTQV
jgi:hypothetical protein